MSRESYGSQSQDITADAALRRRYFNPRTVRVGTRVPYRVADDATDDRAWHDAESVLASRGLRLDDDGSGFVVRRDDRPSFF